MSYKDITGGRFALAAAATALLALPLFGVGGGCGSPRRVLVLVPHHYLFEGTVLDARSGRPLRGAALTLAIGRDRDPPASMRARPAERVSFAKHGALVPEVVVADGAFRFYYLLRYCESYSEFLGIRYDRTDRPPPVKFLLTARADGYATASQEVLPPTKYSPRHDYAITGIVVALEPQDGAGETANR